MIFLPRKLHQEVVVYATFESWVKRIKPDRQGDNSEVNHKCNIVLR